PSLRVGQGEVDFFLRRDVQRGPDGIHVSAFARDDAKVVSEPLVTAILVTKAVLVRQLVAGQLTVEETKEGAERVLLIFGMKTVVPPGRSERLVDRIAEHPGDAFADPGRSCVFLADGAGVDD